jgi:hypothetical protein
LVMKRLPYQIHPAALIHGYSIAKRGKKGKCLT